MNPESSPSDRLEEYLVRVKAALGMNENLSWFDVLQDLENPNSPVMAMKSKLDAVLGDKRDLQATLRRVETEVSIILSAAAQVLTLIRAVLNEDVPTGGCSLNCKEHLVTMQVKKNVDNFYVLSVFAEGHEVVRHFLTDNVGNLLGKAFRSGSWLPSSSREGT